MRGLCGYGRYDDDPAHVGCPRAKSDMTPCIARDGALALADDLACVGCDLHPAVLLDELRRVGVDEIDPPNINVRSVQQSRAAADRLKAIVYLVTNPAAAP